MKTLAEIQKELRDILPEGIDLTFKALRSCLSEGTDKYKDIILLESRYMEMTRQLLQGIVSNDSAQLEFNKIRKELLDFIDSLQESHLRQAGQAGGSNEAPDIYNGELLYRIPPQMVINQEVKCLVRLAFDRKILMEDLEKEEHDVMKDLRISDVMGVELLDLSNEAFVIRTLNDTVQFVEKDLYTEWLFFVKPILEGAHSLMLKISVIEIRNGVERKRNVVLEEKIMILTTPAEDVAGEEGAFQSAGYMMQVAGNPAVEPPETGGSKPPPPVQPAPPSWIEIPAPKPQVVPSRGGFRKMTAVLAGLVVLVVASWAIWMNILPSTNAIDSVAQDWDKAQQLDTKDGYEEFIKAHPESGYADEARAKLGNIETVIWLAALDAGDADAIRAYLAAYPEGRYVADAVAALRQLEEKEGPEGTKESGETKEVAPVKPKDTPLVNNKEKKKEAPQQKKETGSKPESKVGPARQPEHIPEAPKKKEEPDPNQPIPLLNAFRMPAFQKCSNKDAQKEFKCTEESIRKFINRRLEYPQRAINQRIQGTVQVEFIVERDGSISDVHYLNDIGGGCAEAAVRMVKSMPKFKPGLDKQGQPVRILYRLPVKFQVN